MKAEHHAISGGIAASLLIPFLGVNSITFWVASVLIDGDHYVDYLYRNRFKDFSVRRMFTFHDLLSIEFIKQGSLGLNLMHTVEFLLAVFVFYVFTGWVWVLAVLGGMLFHIITDIIYMYRRGIVFKRAFSIIEYVIRWRRMKRQGLHPERPYNTALEAMSIIRRPSDDEVGQTAQQDKQVAQKHN